VREAVQSPEGGGGVEEPVGFFRTRKGCREPELRLFEDGLRMAVVRCGREVVGFKGIGWLSLLLLLSLGLMLGSKAGDFLALKPDAPRHGADLLVVLGGGWKARTAAGGALMLDGWAPRVLLTGIPKTRNREGEPLDNPRYSDLRGLGISKEKILVDSS